MTTMIGAAEFKARCLRVIRQINTNGKKVTITRWGRPAAVLSPVQPPGEHPSIIGAMRGSVLAYHDPFQPAAGPSDWSATK